MIEKNNMYIAMTFNTRTCLKSNLDYGQNRMAYAHLQLDHFFSPRSVGLRPILNGVDKVEDGNGENEGCCNRGPVKAVEHIVVDLVV